MPTPAATSPATATPCLRATAAAANVVGQGSRTAPAYPSTTGFPVYIRRNCSSLSAPPVTPGSTAACGNGAGFRKCWSSSGASNIPTFPSSSSFHLPFWATRWESSHEPSSSRSGSQGGGQESGLGLVRVRSLVLDSVTSVHSRRAYGRALDEFRNWGEASFAGGFTRETVQRYRAHLESRGLSPSSLNVYLSALRRLAKEGAAAGLLSQEQAAAIASVPGARQKGRRLGAWLTLEQTQTLLVAPKGEGMKAVRDRALLGLLIGCGLRRDELAHITVEQIQQREGRWVLVDIEGKGRRLRSVPMPGWTKARIDFWITAGGILSGRLFRAVSQGGEVEATELLPRRCI